MQHVNITPALGAEITGLDLTKPLPVAAIQALLGERLMVCFRDQNLTPETLAQFGAQFGELMPHPMAEHRLPGFDSIMPVRTGPESKFAFGELWHSDHSGQKTPTALTGLYIQTVPDCGGDTLFANMHMAYEALSPKMRELVEGLTAYHTGHKPEKGYIFVGSGKLTIAEHPLVIAHPVTGKPALYCNPCTATNIPQLEWHESEAVLKMLWAHMLHPRFQCRLRWTPNTVTLWDNRATMHTAIWDYYPQTREGLRLITKGPALTPARPDRCTFAGLKH